MRFTHRRHGLVLFFIVAFALVGLRAPAAQAAQGQGATVLHPGEFDCFFEPGDVPGVDVFFPARCTLVITPSGNTQIIAHGQLPAGFSLNKTFVGDVPCFGGTGRIVATPSGRVNATCHFTP